MNVGFISIIPRSMYEKFSIVRKFEEKCRNHGLKEFKNPSKKYKKREGHNREKKCVWNRTQESHIEEDT